MKKAILLLLGVVLIWAALALFFLGSPALAEITHLSTALYDIVSVVIGFAGFICICHRNDMIRRQA